MIVRLKQLRFLLDDPNWAQRTGIGVGLMFLGTVFFPIWWLVDGYALGLMRQAQRGDDLHLPPWHDWAHIAKEGLLINVIRFVYSIPVLLIGLVGVLSSALGVLEAVQGIIPRAGYPFGMLSSSLMTIFVGSLISVPISLFVSYITPLAALRYSETGQVWLSFRIMPIIRMVMRAPVSYSIAWTVARGLLFIGVILGQLAVSTGVLGWLSFVVIGVFGYFSTTLTFTVYGLAWAFSRQQQGKPLLDAHNVVVLDEKPIFSD